MTNTTIADLLPPKRKVEIAKGRVLEVRGLSTEELVKIGSQHQKILSDLFSQRGLPDYSSLIATAPALVVDLVALAADAPGQEESIKKIPAGAQALLLQAIWEETFPDPKAVMALFEWMAKGVRSVEKAMPVPAVQSRSKDGLPSQSIISSQAATH